MAISGMLLNSAKGGVAHVSPMHKARLASKGGACEGSVLSDEERGMYYSAAPAAELRRVHAGSASGKPASSDSAYGQANGFRHSSSYNDMQYARSDSHDDHRPSRGQPAWGSKGFWTSSQCVMMTLVAMSLILTMVVIEKLASRAHRLHYVEGLNLAMQLELEEVRAGSALQASKVKALEQQLEQAKSTCTQRLQDGTSRVAALEATVSSIRAQTAAKTGAAAKGAAAGAATTQVGGAAKAA